MLEAEDKMWLEGILGEDNPKQLLDTIVFLLGIHCALQGGEEHRKLHRPGFHPQLELSKDGDGHDCLIYHADPRSKTN